MHGVAATLLWLAACCATAAGAATYDHRAYGKAISDISGAMANSDFARLDGMHEQFLAPDARTLDGRWMVYAFQQEFEQRFAYESPATIEKRFAAWKKQDPSSTLRPIAEAFAWQQRAWMVKGTRDYAQQSTSERKAFNGLVARAAAALAEGQAAGVRSPLWHTAALLVAGAQGRPAPELDAILDDAARRFPAFQPLFAARMVFLMPDWGGDFEAVDRFVRQSAERTREKEGRAMYAWLYLEVALARNCECWFGQSRVSWPDMRAAFEDMLERHPDVWNRNIFATFACRARDADTTRRMLGELGSSANLGFASSGISTESCRQMVRPPPPAQTLTLGNPLSIAPVSSR